MQWDSLTTTEPEALAVVASVVGIYLTFTVLVRLFSQRSVARLSAIDVPVVLMVGSIGGRVVTGRTPTLATGAIALITLFLLHWLVQHFARTRPGSRLVRDAPVVLMVGPDVRERVLARTRITHKELWAALRMAGIRNRAEVACVILESAGTISVIKTGAPLDRELLSGVEGIDEMHTETLGQRES